MKFHGINCTGKFVLQKVASLPTWTSSDEGRLIYDATENKLYVGNNTEWQEAGSGGYGSPEVGFSNGSVMTSSKLYFIDTSYGTMNAYLPPTPSAGDTIAVVDINGTFNTYPLTLHGNGNNIHNDPSLEVDIKDIILTLVFTGSVWKIDVGGIVSVSGGTQEYTEEFNSDFEAMAYLNAFVDTRDNIVVVTLPIETNLENGTTVTISDQYLSFGINECIVYSPTAEFENGTNNVHLTNSGAKVVFTWNAGTGKWMTEQPSSSLIGNLVNATGDYDANVNDFIFVNTSINPVTITLPPSGYLKDGATISIFDQMGTFESNNVSILPSFGTIKRDTSFLAKYNNSRVDFIWDSVERDWKVDIGGDVSLDNLNLDEVNWNEAINWDEVNWDEVVNWSEAINWEDVSPATQTSSGVVMLASESEALDGTDSAKVITPSTLQAKLNSQFQQTYTRTYNETFAASTSWVVNHELGDYPLVVQCWNSDTNDSALLAPESIVRTSADQIVISWGTKSIAGQVCVIQTKLDAEIPQTYNRVYNETFTASTSWTVNHDLNNFPLVVQCWSSDTIDSALLTPDSIVRTSVNQVIINWGTKNVSGQACIYA